MVDQAASDRTPDLRVFPDVDAVSRALAQTVALAVGGAPDRPFTLALTGGRSAARVYAVLGATYLHHDWSHVQFWWSDERLVPQDDPESNYNSVWQHWLSKTRVTPEQLFAPDTSINDPEAVAIRYERDIRRLLGSRLTFDCVLLSLGEDGHVASLFPGRTESREDRLVVPVVNSPKQPSRRVTMTLALLGRGLSIHVLAVGPDKAEALRLTLSGTARPGAHPLPGVSLLLSAPHVVWWTDTAAARLLDEPPKQT